MNMAWTYSHPVRHTSPPITEETKNPDRYRILGSRVDTECIDVLYALDLGHGFCLGNVLKYIIRSRNAELAGDANAHETTITDLKKARHYLDIIIQREEEEEEGEG